MSKHTAGPWMLAEDGTIRSHDFTNSDMMADYVGVLVCDLKPAVGCEEWPGTTRRHAVPEALANGRLIVAAPDLLAALQWYVQNDETENNLHNAWWIGGKIRAQEAIAKATGDTP